MKDKIMEFVTRRGPVLVTDVSREFRIDSMFAGAYLSELVKDRKLKISNTKVGSSPLYYLPEHERNLEEFSRYLEEKDKRAYDLIKEKKVIWDKELNPLMQVAIRKIKDFAIPLRVNKTEIFWKYFLFDQEEAIKIIKATLTEASEEKVPEIVEKKDIEKKETVKKESDVLKRSLEKRQAMKREEAKRDDVKREELKKGELTRIDTRKQEVRRGTESERSGARSVENEREDRRDTNRSEVIGSSKIDDQRAMMKEMIKEELDKEKKKLEKEFQLKFEQEKKAMHDKQTKQEKLDVPDVVDAFFTGVKKLLIERKINVTNFEIVKKEKEIELVLEIPSAVGLIAYFCQAKNKKRCNEKDIEEIYTKAKEKGLPGLLICGGLTKNAEGMIGKYSGNVNVMKFV